MNRHALLTDYHVHTPLCKHARGAPRQMVERALALGLREIGFADHICLPAGVQAGIRMAEDELGRYLEEVQQLAREYEGRIPVRLGLEADFYPGLEDYVGRIIAAHPFDYVIGSIHFLPEETHRPRHPVSRYLEAAREAAATGLFDILGHVNWILRGGSTRPPAYRKMVLAALAQTRDSGMAVEVNTSGSFHPRVGHPYPEADFFREIVELELPVTICSDAHSPEEVGRLFLPVLTRLQAAGLKRLALWRRRRRSFVELPPAGGRDPARPS